MRGSTTGDELAIHALVARYCHAVLQRDHEAWASTWDEDAQWCLLGRSARGRAGIVALYHKLVGGTRWIVQQTSNGLVELAGDRATGRWIVTEHLQASDGTPGLNVGLYCDDYRRGRDGVWRFARRRFEPCYLGPPGLTAPPRPLPTDV